VIGGEFECDREKAGVAACVFAAEIKGHKIGRFGVNVYGVYVENYFWWGGLIS
jgi:hypothetical protein